MKELTQVLKKVGGRGSKLSDDIKSIAEMAADRFRAPDGMKTLSGAAKNLRNAAAGGGKPKTLLDKGTDALKGLRHDARKGGTIAKSALADAGRSVARHGKGAADDIGKYAKKNPWQAGGVGAGALGLLGGSGYALKKLLEDDEDDEGGRPYLRGR